MAALAKISLSFGLINAGVSVHNALEPKVSNKSVCTGSIPTVDAHGVTGVTGDHAPRKINQVQRCTTCAENVPYAEIKKAREVPGGFVLLDVEEIKGAKADNEKHKKLASLTPHPAPDVEAGTVPGEKLYYLTPEAGAEQAYAVLHHLVHTHTELTFMTLWVPRSAVGVFALRTRGDVLVLQERVPAAATKAAPAITADAPAPLLAMADQFLTIDGVVTDFDAAAYADTYEANIQKIIASKVPVPATPDAATPVVASGGDLMANLAAQIAAAGNVTAITKKKSPRKKAA